MNIGTIHHSLLTIHSPPLPLRHQHRDDAAAAVTVNTKMFVQGKHPVTETAFDHGHQRSVGERHREGAVFLHQRKYPSRFVLKLKRDPNEAILEPFPYLANRSGHALQKKASLGQNRFTGQKRHTDRCKGFPHPRVRRFPAIYERNQGAGIEQNPLPHRPNPSMCFGFVARSVTPLSTHPQPSFIKS